jgi:hypothetical protein
MSIDENVVSDGRQSLILGAQNHIACTSKSVEVKQGKYAFSLQVQSPNAKYAGYYIGFKEATSTSYSDRIQINDSDWHTHTRIVDIPKGVSKLYVYLYSYAADGKTNIVTRYDKVELRLLEKLTEIPLSSMNSGYEKLPFVAQEGTSTFRYVDAYYSGKNIIPNPAFESGLWQDKVGDCYNYDNDPELRMSIYNGLSRQHSNSLQLEAQRHVACTSQSIPISEGTYQFSFDYESPNAHSMRYFLVFDDSGKTGVKDEVAIDDKEWKSYSKIITVPKGVSNATLYVYSSQTNQTQWVVNRYDNFSLVLVPEIQNNYIYVSKSNKVDKIQNPGSVTFTVVDTTKKLVSVNGAHTSFYLAMSENYYPKWQAELNNSKSNGRFTSWIPWVHPDKIQDDFHFKLDGFLNGWYVDPVALCATSKNRESGISSSSLSTLRTLQTSDSLKPGCSVNPDGSYNMELIIEFTPQRWFYVGLIISGVTLFSCISYLGYDFVRSRRRKKGESANIVHN